MPVTVMNQGATSTAQNQAATNVLLSQLNTLMMTTADESTQTRESINQLAGKFDDIIEKLETLISLLT